jgi:hypothetical protein
MHTQFQSRDLQGKAHLGDLDVGGRVSLSQRVGEDAVWIYLTQEGVLKPSIFNTY